MRAITENVCSGSMAEAIESLLSEIAGGGVPYRQIGDVCFLKRGKAITKKTAPKGDVPVVSGGLSAAYHVATSNHAAPVLTCAGSGASAGTILWWDEPVWVGDAFSIDPIDENILDKRFVYHFLKSIQPDLNEMKQGAGIPHVYPSHVASIEIPIPPIDIQKLIVTILDALTELGTKLEMELEARSEHYRSIRESLLSADDISLVSGDAVSDCIVPLSSVGTFERGSGIQKKDFVSSGRPCIHYGQIYTKYGTQADRSVSFLRPEQYARSRKANPGDCVIATTSENIRDCGKCVAWLGDEPIAVSGDAFIFHPHDCDARYISYVFQSDGFFEQKKTKVTGTQILRLNAASMGHINVPIPPIDTQRIIADMLEASENITNSTIEGIPAEIAQRRAQLAWYREHLLAFPRAN